MANPNLAVKERFVTALFSGDTATMEELLAPDFELHQPKGLAYEGVYKGFAGFMQFVEKYMAAYNAETLDTTAVFYAEDNPDVIVFEFLSQGTLQSNGKRYDSTIMEPWYFRDGQITLIRPHWFEQPPLS